MTTRRGDLFFLQAHTGTCASHTKRMEKVFKGFRKNEVELNRKVKIINREIPGSRRSNRGYILTYSRFQRENLSQFWVLYRGYLHFWVVSTPLQGLDDEAMYWKRVVRVINTTS